MWRIILHTRPSGIVYKPRISYSSRAPNQLLHLNEHVNENLATMGRPFA